MDVDQSSFELTIRVKTQQVIVQESQSEFELPIRRWQIEICMLDSKGEETDANILKTCTYHLHPSFINPVRKIKELPFTVEETGWGEFEVKIVCEFLDKGGKFRINHDLTFSEEAYAIDYSVEVPYYINSIRQILVKHFDVPHVKELIPSSNYVNLWNKVIPTLDEDEITKFVEIILHNTAVQVEIDKYDRKQPFHMFLGQLPEDLQVKLKDYLHNRFNQSDTISIENDIVDEEDIFTVIPEITTKVNKKRP